MNQHVNAEGFWYFAFGSNLDVAQMKARCPDAVRVGPAVLPGYRLVFRSVADVVPAREGDNVQGGIWWISKRDLANLDRYEGFPDLYTRGPLPVVDHHGAARQALVYWMVDQRDEIIPSRSYLGSIIQGYLDFNLPLAELQKSVERTGRDMGRRGVARVVELGRRTYTVDEYITRSEQIRRQGSARTVPSKRRARGASDLRTNERAWGTVV